MVVSTSDHIVKAYDEELDDLRLTLLKMGELIDIQLRDAVLAITTSDVDKAASVRKVEKDVDAFEEEIDAKVMKILALRQPVANDLRLIIAILKSASDLERIGDYARNIVRRFKSLQKIEQTGNQNGIITMTRNVRLMLKNCMLAFEKDDADSLISVWQCDDEIDSLYTSIYREALTYMMENPRNITYCGHIIFFAKLLERAADHIVNISEMMYFHITGDKLMDTVNSSDS